MLDAFWLGFIGASSLVVGAAYSIWRPPGRRQLGLILAFGSGVLISAVAYQLVGEAFTTSSGEGPISFGLLAGALTFFVGDALIDRSGGAHRKDATGQQASGSGLAIVLGTVLDGIPESIVLGVGVATEETTSVAMLFAVFVSNLPEAMASTSGLLAAGWTTRSLYLMWTGIVLVSAASASIGYAVFGDLSSSVVAFVLAYAGGAVLTMLADTMMPDAFAHGGRLTGVITTVGFAFGFGFALL